MKKAILISIILIFLTGCGFYNLNFFTLPDDAEFIALIQELDTPKKICQYMVDNFTYEPHAFYILNPHELYLIKKGDCDEFSNFAKFAANYHNYETYQIKIFYKGTLKKHTIAVFVENGYLSVVDFSYYFAGFHTFSEIVNFNGKYMIPHRDWRKYIVYDYDMNIVEINYNN